MQNISQMMPGNINDVSRNIMPQITHSNIPATQDKGMSRSSQPYLEVISRRFTDPERVETINKISNLNDTIMELLDNALYIRYSDGRDVPDLAILKRITELSDEATSLTISLYGSEL